MHKLMPGYANAVVKAIRDLETNPTTSEVSINNGTGLRLTRDDVYAKGKQEKGIRCLGTEKHAGKAYLVFQK